MTASHERPGDGNDGQIVKQAFKSRVTTGPIDTIEKDVALTSCRKEIVLIEARQEPAVVVGFQTPCPKGPIEALVEKLSDVCASCVLDEDELAILYCACDSRKYFIELGQIFKKRLTTPIDDSG